MKQDNLGATTLRRRKRAADPMRAYDGLPKPLRRWLAEAHLPWSPTSCRRIWNKALRDGRSVEDAVAYLNIAEQKTLARDQVRKPN